MKSTPRSLSLALALGLALAACGGSDGGDGDAAGSEAASTGESSSEEAGGSDLPLVEFNEQPRDALTEGGQLRFAISLFPTNWNSLNVDGNIVPQARIEDFTMPRNWIFAEDASFEPDPDWVQDYDVQDATEDTGQVVTLDLNPDAVWNSGDTIDWEDYQASWQACNGEDEAFNCASTDGWNQIVSVEQGESPTQVVVTFESAYPDWSSVLSSVWPAEGVADADTFNEAWSGNDNYNEDWHTGPFAFESIDEAQRTLTLVPNESWWGEAPLLEQVSFQELQNPADVQAFANGEVDVVETMIDSNSYTQAQARSDGEIRTAGSLQWRHFTFNSTSGALQDVEVRQAIQKATNREAMAQSDLAGLPVDPAALMLGNHFFMPGQDGYVDNSGDFTYDPEAAMSQLDEAGWTMPEGGEFRENEAGETLSIDYALLTGVATSENEGQLLQADLANVGIELNLVNTPTDDFTATLVDGTFGIIAFTWNGTNYPMANVRQIYGAQSASSDQPSDSNFAQLIIPEVEDLIPQIDTEEDRPTRVDLTNEADAAIWAAGHTLPIYRRQEFTGVPANLANFGAATFKSIQPEDIGYTE